MMNRQLLKRNCISCRRIRVFATTILMFMFVFAAESGSAGMAGAGSVAAQPNSGIRETSSSEAVDPLVGVSFPTSYRTGPDVCTSDDGKPVLFLFSSASCSHCEWAGEAFDFIARYYMASGLVEAHHYDVKTGDDLLIEEIETEIPPAHLQIKEHGDPKGLVPYFNFSCKYERLGNGYEKDDDLAAEGAEIRQVIDTLVQMLSKGD